jgi:hypothetical protein
VRVNVDHGRQEPQGPAPGCTRNPMTRGAF